MLEYGRQGDYLGDKGTDWAFSKFSIDFSYHQDFNFIGIENRPFTIILAEVSEFSLYIDVKETQKVRIMMDVWANNLE